jgi:hypothetical protein
VFARGTLDAPLLLDAQHVVLARRLGDAWAITAISNASDATQVTVALPAGAPREWRDALSGAVHRVGEDGRLVLALPALSGVALVSAP